MSDPSQTSSFPAPFHPVITSWFRERVGVPTDVQARAWPVIAAGGHVLLTAPTGSGKTFTAFLWALNRFATGDVLPGTVRILYISPLKALNNDIQRNLLGPLEDLRGRFLEQGLDFPSLRAQVRSGDTPGAERRRMLRHPPEILITTPESLNLLLLGKAGRDSLRGVRTVILDEVHAVAGTKRGVHLITAVDRLVPLAGEFQRIALSATVRPLPLVAAWVGGYRREGEAYAPRPVDIVESRVPKAYRLEVRYPVEGVAKRGSDVGTVHGDGRLGPSRGGASAAGPGADLAPVEPREAERTVWESMALEIKDLVKTSRSTLVFANNRRLSERLARLLNEGEEKPIAYAHHGSLSREIRAVVEARMKEGRLPAIVATSSLELGIDVG
ncbi:MAG TPA: DEAD/DEAH box helicase, partial [Fibrobacteria bacterium]|nr:DEAD/DEAH box helicase [Fibrobacteria bacterium]